MIKVLYLMANVIAKRNEEDCLCIKLRQEYLKRMSRSLTKCHVLESISQRCPLFYLRHGNCDDDICSNGKANVQVSTSGAPKCSSSTKLLLSLLCSPKVL